MLTCSGIHIRNSSDTFTFTIFNTMSPDNSISTADDMMCFKASIAVTEFTRLKDCKFQIVYTVLNQFFISVRFVMLVVESL